MELNGELRTMSNYGLTEEVFNEYTSSNNTPKEFAVSSFKLNDGETAYVRFLIRDMSDMWLINLHSNLEWGDKKYQKVKCLRELKEPLNKCPLCASGVKCDSRVYIRMIQYITDPNTGEVTAKSKIWDRALRSSIVNDLMKHVKVNGDLTNLIFTITRTGKDFNNTNYSITPVLNFAMFPENTYVKDFSAFDDYNVVGGIVRDWNYDEMFHFVQTGDAPTKQSNSNNSAPYTNGTTLNTQPNTPPQYNNYAQQRQYVNEFSNYTDYSSQGYNGVEDNGLPFNLD